MGSDDQLRELLGRVFDIAQDGLRDEIPREDYERRRFDFVFHMTDWTCDVTRLADLVRHPQNENDEAATKFLIGFLYHTIPHLSAAGRLLLDHVPDPFADQPEAAPRAERQ
jgi:hypothetical protein